MTNLCEKCKFRITCSLVNFTNCENTVCTVFELDWKLITKQQQKKIKEILSNE